MNTEQHYLCSICQESSTGFGWAMPQNKAFALTIPDASFDLTASHKFCSRHCQNIFFKLIVNGVNMNSESLRRFAAYSVRKPLNNYVQFIGPERPFSEYSKDDIDGLIQIVLDSYHTKLKDFYEGALKV